MKEIKAKSEVNLRKLMQKLGMGTNAFAEACGMSTQSMAQFLRTESLTTKTIYRIACALDIDPRDMFFPTDESSILQNVKEQESHIICQEKPQAKAEETMFCPRCGTKFVIVNTPNDKEQ